MEEKIKVKNKKLAVTVLSIVALFVIGLNGIQAFVISEASRSKIEKTAEIDYAEITKAYSSLISSTISEYIGEMDFYVKAEVNKTKDPDQIVEWLKGTASERNKDFDYVAFVYKDGTFKSDKGSVTNVTDRDYFQAIMNKRQPLFIDNPVLSKTTGQRIIHINLPVNVNGDLIGFYSAVISVENLGRLVESIHIGKTGTATLFSGDRQLIATSGDMQKIIDTTANSENSEKRTKDIENASKNGDIIKFWDKRPDGSSVFCLASPVENTMWSVIFIFERSEIFETSDLVIKYLVTGTTILSVSLLVVIGLLISRALAPLNVLESSINEIATGNADLTKRIILKHRANNEIGRVVDGFNKFSEKLQTIIAAMKESKVELDNAGQNLTESTHDTSSSIEEIIANIESLGNNISNQSDSVNQTAGAVNQIASNIESLNNMIESQSASVSQASAAVEEMIGNINSVNSSVTKMARSFDELEGQAVSGAKLQEDVNAKILVIEEDSHSLQEANAVISSIAEQTNLLAMNAAIEAAHAGEAGKGFSVVADEIRKLSETSSAQSKTIGTQLQKITESIDQIVVASKNAGKAFADVTGGINSTNNLVQEIKNAMEEQEEGSKQISEALNHMNDSTSEVKSASEEMSEGNKTILEEIKNLQEATFGMKTGMEEMNIGAKKINETGATLSNLSSQMENSILKIGIQVDQFKV